VHEPAALAAHLDCLLALWRDHGWDREHAGFHSRLACADLAPVRDGFKRLVVQTRQLFTFSDAALRARADASSRAPGGAVSFAGAADIAHATYEYICGRFWDTKHGGWIYTVTPEGEPLDRRKDLYAHAFVLLALGTYARLAPTSQALAQAEETYALLRQHLVDPDGGYREVATEEWWPEPGPRLQNPHMHLLEGALALLEATGEEPLSAGARSDGSGSSGPSHATPLGAPRSAGSHSAGSHSAGSGSEVWRELANELVALLAERMFAPRPGCLPERFGPGWTADPEDPMGLEPGHHFEWVWLLDRAQRLGVPVPEDVARALFAHATRHGIDAVHGGVVDRLTWSGAVADARKRVWPQTEHIKALTTPLGGEAAGPTLQSALALCFARYVDAERGGWQEHAERAGTIFTDKMNATTVYHVWVALQEAIRRLRGA
jgi:mannose/cellobiose epimerase-like protein (N-acyl-D-glucosamine 2-epimerase family)